MYVFLSAQEEFSDETPATAEVEGGGAVIWRRAGGRGIAKIVCTKVCSKFLKVSVYMPDLGGMSIAMCWNVVVAAVSVRFCRSGIFFKIYVSYIGSNNSYGEPRNTTLGAFGKRVGVNVFFRFLILARRFI